VTLLVAAHPEWEAWKAKHSKEYEAIEEMKRQQIWEENRIYIKKYNEANNGVQLEMNHFGDLTTTEFGERHLGGYIPSKQRLGATFLGTHVHDGNSTLPDSVDWTANGAVTPVKNQGQCGSCWSFSTTGAMEGAWFLHTKKLVSLSEQQLVDCAHNGNQGCHGGSMDAAFTFEKGVNVCTEDSYPYQGADGTCKTSCTTGIPKGGVTGLKDVAHDEQSMMSAVAQQPVSIAIEADKSVFQFYKSGVLQSMCGTNLDHGVLAVGYGELAGKKYWKVKNSWGATWGQEGFILLQRGKGGSGECGILQDASYPVVGGSPGPAPGPTPGPSPTPPPAPTGSHYDKPPCLSDEMQAQIQGTDGVLCAPKCTGQTCPTDVPAGTTDQPKCVLQDQSGNHYCALTCLLGGCPTGASCKHISLLTGICMFPSGEYATSNTMTTMSLANGENDMVI